MSAFSNIWRGNDSHVRLLNEVLKKTLVFSNFLTHAQARSFLALRRWRLTLIVELSSKMRQNEYYHRIDVWTVRLFVMTDNIRRGLVWLVVSATVG